MGGLRPVYQLLGVCLAGVALGAPQNAAAHPHVWVTVETEVVYDDQKAITGFRHKWLFDEFYSSFAIQGLDKNEDGKYDASELQELADINVQSMKDFEYFTFPKVGEKLLERMPPKDYRIEYGGSQLTLYVTVPLKSPLPADQLKDFTLGVYDPTFYVEFSFAKDDPIRLSAAPANCTPVIKDPDSRSAENGVSNLSESMFTELGASSTIGEQYAKLVHITCPAS